ncbi:MAG TPA: PDZ domain-containing protein [Chitinophaga sp.]|uniref:S41 family peptidase n=1 Tax=Chitinophaga sp. TaxID=1869181 RepID=UPI002C39E8C2|nr:PDZ domain-containing protein [Chitinophaga sp.]HVI45001.1 PDZ domain-containing protein [Chitinophaga sp.]
MRCTLVLMAAMLGSTATAQIHAGLFRYPDVSQTQIAFCYANDVWVVPKEGGTAIKLSSPPGAERYPKFSPDGKKLAFSANYDGNVDVYVLPVDGGVPLRLTQHGYPDAVVDWTPDGKRILFASGRESTKDRYNQFYTVSQDGGPAEKLPLAIAEFGSYSPDGRSMALVTRSQASRNWKRYRGGWKADINIFHFDTRQSEIITPEDEPGQEFPMWYKNYIYFLSDRGQEKRMNLWRYNLDNKSYEQLTNYKDYDIHYPSMGPSDIVYEASGKLYLFSLATQQSKEVPVQITTDLAALRPRVVKTGSLVQYATISPDGNRALLSARGDIFSVPAENGYVKDVTRTSGAAERYAAWSPDGRYIVYWSDQSGEYELYLAETGKEHLAKKITSYGPGFRYRPYWSPDSKKVVFIDSNEKIYLLDVFSGKTTSIDKAVSLSHPGMEGFRIKWSPDSRWITYSRNLENRHNAVFLYDTRDGKLHQATSGYYDCSEPAFDPNGKYLYLFTNRTFRPSYSDHDNSFIYSNSTNVAAISLKKNTPSLLYTRNDTVGIKQADAAPEAAKKDDKKKDDKKKKPEEDKKPSKSAATDIDLDGLEYRMVVLPVEAGNYGRMNAVKGKILYVNFPNTGSYDQQGVLKYYDTEKREEKTIFKNPGDYELSDNGEKILVQGSRLGVIDVAENQKLDKTLRVEEMEMMLDPVQEWRQLFLDAWRIERDFFYDPNMHGVNWNEVKEKYLRMLEGARTREEVSFVLGDMIGEMNASHAYNSGGDIESPRQENVGYLGVDWEADGKYYKIKRIIRSAPWDAEVRSPLDEAGVNINEGDYILAVNGVPLTTAQEPFAVFQTLAEKPVELTYNTRPSWDGAKTAVVKAMRNDYRLRHLAWIEGNRKRVAEATNDQVGYIFVPSTGIDGQDELVRQFTAQWNKAALIIDERFNNGGQIPDRFIELLNRKPASYWVSRNEDPNTGPMLTNLGPKVMLINAWSGSGGDAFPDYFRKAGLGTLVGARTWGGLIGISGAPPLVDGGDLSVPSFRMINPDGTWFREGHGVDPDIRVSENLGEMAKGVDPQLEAAIKEIVSQLKTKSVKGVTRPTPEIR